MEEPESHLTVDVTLKMVGGLDSASMCCEREHIWNILNTEVEHTKKKEKKERKRENPTFFLKKVHGIWGAKFP